MRNFVLTIKQPGTLFGKVLETEISPAQLAAITAIATEPDKYVLVAREAVPTKPPIGFQPPK